MRFDSIALRGLGPFRGEVAIDLAAIPGRIVAVTGANGAGKSTLLELLAGALYRQTPTRGSLADLATDRNGYLEVKVVNGAAYTLRHTVDKVSGKGEALVLDAAGAPVLADVKVRSFDTWAAAHLPPAAVLYASTFAAQGSGGFLELKPGDRKGVLLRLLGVEALERQAERARDRGRAARTALETVHARIADERERGGDIGAAELQIARAGVAAEEEDRRLAVAAAELAEAERRLAAAEQARRDADAIRQRRAECGDALAAAKGKAADLDERVKNNRTLLAGGADVRAAVARAPALLAEWEAAAGEVARLEALRAAQQAVVTGHRRRADEVKAGIQALVARLGRAEARLVDEQRVATAAAALPDLRAAAADAEAYEAELAAEIETVRGQALGVAARRIGGLREGLSDIADLREADRGPSVVSAPDMACDVLAYDDGVEAEAEAAPGEAKRIGEELAAARRTAAEARRDVAAAAALAVRVLEMVDARNEERLVAAELARAEEDAKKTALAATQEGRALSEIDRQFLAADVRRAELAEERAALDPVVKRAEKLAAAETRLAELEPALAEAAAEVARLTAAAAALPALPAPVVADERERAVRGARAAVGEAEQSARAAHGMIAVARARLETAMLSARRAEELEAARRAEEDHVADWALLSEGLGRDGIQALLIDASGPEISEITNALLHEAFGPRFTVRFDTTKRSSDNKKELETFDIGVVDTESGRDGPAEGLSGGEKVIISEALSLALSTVACRRSGLTDVSLVRDETGAALDPANGRRYVQMLRRAADLIGASRVFFVSHSRELAEMADARIVVSNGGVEVLS